MVPFDPKKVPKYIRGKGEHGRDGKVCVLSCSMVSFDPKKVQKYIRGNGELGRDGKYMFYLSSFDPNMVPKSISEKSWVGMCRKGLELHEIRNSFTGSFPVKNVVKCCFQASGWMQNLKIFWGFTPDPIGGLTAPPKPPADKFAPYGAQRAYGAQRPYGARSARISLDLKNFQEKNLFTTIMSEFKGKRKKQFLSRN